MPDEFATAQFLGPEYAWSDAQIELRDVQQLYGGFMVLVPGYTMSQAIVTRVTPGGKETKYRLALGWDEKKDLCRLFVQQDFLTIQPSERSGVPDEARPAITLRNARRESHTVAKWAGVVDARFDALYGALLALAERTTGQRPVPNRFTGWQKGLLAASGIAGLALMALASYVLARPLIAAWWPARGGWLLALLLLLMPLLLAGMRGLGWLERRQPPWERTFTNPGIVAIANLLFFLAVIGAIGLVETAVRAWVAGPPFSLAADRAAYATMAYSAVFGVAILLGAAAVAADPLLRLLDERF